MSYTPQLLADFTLTQEQLLETVQVFSDRISRGLSQNGQEGSGKQDLGLSRQDEGHS